MLHIRKTEGTVNHEGTSQKELFGRAEWITPDREGVAAPVIEKSFEAGDAVSAELTITGLGWFYAELNGEPVTEDRFVPLASDYAARKFSDITYPFRDRVKHRIYCCRYDVTPLLTRGAQTLTVQLAGGWYRQNERIAEGRMSYGEDLKTVFRITLLTASGESREVFSDGTEKWRESRIRESELFLGETVDAAFCDGGPRPVRIAGVPDALLSLQDGTPDRVIRTFRPAMLSCDGKTRVYDCAENISGVVRVRCGAGHAGERIVLRFAEVLDENGRPDPGSTGAGYACASGRSQEMTDVFICGDEAAAFEPRFTWHAFRYFEVSGPAEDPEVLVIHADTPVTAEFDSDSEGLNFLFDAFVRTQLNNMHCGFPSDCPHRERLGYTGDGQAAGPAAMAVLDAEGFYRKWIRDIFDGQDETGGHIQHTAPFQGGGGGPGGWGCAAVLVPWAFYMQYGDANILREYYPCMKRWMEYLRTRSEGGLVVREEEGGWCLGDWCAPVREQLPVPFVNTYYRIRCLRLMAQIAELTGNAADVPAFRTEEADTLEAFTRAYRDPETGHWCDGTRGADAFAAGLGLTPETCAAFAAERADRLRSFDTGFLGTDILMDVMFRFGQADAAYRLLSSDVPGTFLYMKRRGATTIWERWSGGCSSHDHPMFGGCARQLFSSVLGIRQREGSAGYRDIVIAPCIPSNPLQEPRRASGSILTPAGRIGAAWTRDGSGVRFTVTVPEGIRAQFCFGRVTKTLGAGKNEITV